MHLIPAVRLQKKYFNKLYNVPAKQDYVGMIYKWIGDKKSPVFKKFYFFLLLNYGKTLLYCIKQWVVTGNTFYYMLLFKQRFRFLVYCLFNPRKIKNDFNVVAAFNKKLYK